MTEIAGAASSQIQVPKLVQQIAKKGVEVPDEFLYKNGFPDAIDDPQLWNDTLLIDFSLLSTTHELAKFYSILTTWGCFQVKNHGMEKSVLEEVIKVTKEFYEQPLEEKMKSCSSGYGELQGYSTDAICKMNQPTNWNDRLFLILHPKDTGNPLFWPQNPTTFREVVDEYTMKLMKMTEGIYKAMARTLNLEEDTFIKPTKDGMTLGRFTVYPPCPYPERVLGSAPHLDGTTMTVILTNVEGLQVQKDAQWYKVPVIPGALFVNVGDYIEVMTNGKFKSVMHRVVTNSTEARTSIGAFCGPERNCEIEPLRELVSQEEPALYKKFKASDYLNIFYDTFPNGRNAIDALKL
ncbi:protein LATERAL BRANCHING OXIDOREDUCTASE 1-like [Silene latifolia]|uniref:protein LATERAL BRANCHING OXIDOREDUCTASE 1-like n=1 Tax=Silene latifolia TaxID=37657 RepID=UPI003D7844E3